MRWLVLILFVKAIILALIIAYSRIGLAPDEAQYWTWSQALDWGYYSKPPAIAWQIAITTFIFGDTVFGVRFGALIIGFLISLTIYGIARAAELSVKTSFWAACISAFCPLGCYLSLVATTDGGMILFFTLAALLVMQSIKLEQIPNYSLIGLCILAGGLYKWTAFEFWIFLLIASFFFKNLRSWKCLLGICISLIALLPTLYWNVEHEWATFRHVGNTLHGAKKGNFFDFLGAQIGLLSPIFFVLFLMSYFFISKQRKKQLLFSALFPSAILLFLSAALFKKMQPNWAAYLYLPGIPLIAWLACDVLKRGKIWLILGNCCAILVVAFLFMLPALQENTHYHLSYKLNPFRQAVGGDKLATALINAGYQSGSDFLFSDKYQGASLLSFYSPEQKRAYFFNISAMRKNQFSYWPQMEHREVGKTGYFVILENTHEKALNWYETHYQNRLQPYFKKVEYKGAYPLFSAAGEPVKYAMIFACISYLGSRPEEKLKF